MMLTMSVHMVMFALAQAISTVASLWVSMEETNTTNSEFLRYTTMEFVKYVCTPHQRQQERFPAKTECSLDDISELAYCAIRQKIILEIRRITHNQTTNGHKAVFLAFLIHVLHSYKKVDRYFKEIGQPLTFPKCSSNEVFRLARDAAFRCDLHPDSPTRQESAVCRNGVQGMGLLGTHSGDIGPVWLVQWALTLLSLPDMTFPLTDARPRPEIPCWQGSLRKAESIYRMPYHWDINDACIDVLQIIWIRMIKVLMVNLYEEYKKHSQFTEFPASSTNNVKYLARRLLNAAILGSLQYLARERFSKKVYRSVMYFRAEARKRAKIPKLPAVVSCKRFRGHPEDVESNTVLLTRLMMIHKVRRRIYGRNHLLMSGWMYNLDAVLPCVLKETLNIKQENQSLFH